MEKFTAYRDPGTGIQPFLTPVPSIDSDILAKALYPFSIVLGVVRTILLFCLIPIYFVLVHGLCLVLYPIPPLYRFFTWIFTATICRLSLWIIGILWIPVQTVSRKRGRAAQIKSPWAPGEGDIIVSNWIGWIELLWLAFRFNPVFLLPVAEHPPVESTQSSAPISTTGRRTGTGSANVTPGKNRISCPVVPIKGFKSVSLFTMIRLTGKILPLVDTKSHRIRSLEEWTKSVRQPIVIFPECTTSNGRGMLKFASLFKETAPSRNFNVFLMCVRYDPPSAFAPSASHSIPSLWLNPLPHIFSVASGIISRPISIRLLPQPEGPSSPLFITSEVLSSFDCDDQMSEVSAILIAQLGKLKRVGMGWEDKTSFLRFFYGGKMKKM